MARRPSQISDKLTNAGSDNDGRLARVIIVKVNSKGKIDRSTLSTGELLLNPESVDDEKTSNWVANQIPGQSDPVYQWVSGGPRVVSFDALVTRDTSDFLGPVKNNPFDKLADKAINAIGAIASNFLGVTVTASTFTDSFSGPDTSQVGLDLSIAYKLNYFRSLQYPKYEAGRLATSPPIIALYFGSTLSSLRGDPGSDDIDENTDLWVLLDLKIKITKQLPNLAPMEAIVSFRFNQYTVKSFASDHFVTDTPYSVPDLPSI